MSSLTDKCAAQKLKKIVVLVYGHVYIYNYGHIKKPKKNDRFFMTLAWDCPFNIFYAAVN